MSEINGDNRLADDETTVSLVRTRIEDLRKAITALSGLDPASSPREVLDLVTADLAS
ncbi:hypothetical protein [Planobispora longispora]|uniref:Uncharacterized protein n=1 Tax=Planobispora longispora TaxID=28887 RepID=A0A8J3RS79_9ACTN|nr:hypothetical protein [Planobispora longispora]GIH79251.1 hypothetical protein Plo01_56800 [Planobispora longispora]